MADREPVAGDVSQRYANPETIVSDPALDAAEKVRLLREWEQDLRLLMVATEENMPGTVAGQPAESLRAVRQALETLGVRDGLDEGSPAKTG
jgi:hypothetical protein